ncbi:mycothiol synthase [Brevibacterium sp. XM4083]|uniref:mycothiol synthase n=1 Tax=Brevibacterium sp. XM4083 TaxID=2583238 RepID=UPI0011270D78|nr:mycothiol synthase [Brevibacterium sp. XM4083]MCM1011390.1 mycothiol synthase [Brevibacterium sp. XM4083]
MRIVASGAVTGTPIDTVAEAELAFLDRVTAHDGAAEISGGLLAIATGEDTAHDAQTASSVWRVYADPAAADGDPASTADGDPAAPLIGFGIRARQGERHAAEFLIDPDHRGRGYGEALLTAIFAEEPSAWCWSHGDDPAARHLAARHGLSRDRVLYQMRTDPDLTLDDLPTAAPPDGVTIRSFAPGDEAGWLRVNNAAFDWHPEQGHQTLDDIETIVGAAGFDPATVVIASRSVDGTDTVIGFHETKLTDTDSGDRLGEVFVVGVDPGVHAKGVGRALTVEGMRRMVAAGATAIELYVESDNAPALGLYERLGFHVAVAHVSYAPATPAQSTQEQLDV